MQHILIHGTGGTTVVVQRKHSNDEFKQNIQTPPPKKQKQKKNTQNAPRHSPGRWFCAGTALEVEGHRRG